VIQQLIFIVKVLFAIEAEVVLRALSVVRIEAGFILEDLDDTRHQISLDRYYLVIMRCTDLIVLPAIIVLGIYMLPPRHLEVEMPIARFAVAMIWLCM